eukprot:4562560-Lingulodinium_polyedra.AAC.1
MASGETPPSIAAALPATEASPPATRHSSPTRSLAPSTVRGDTGTEFDTGTGARFTFNETFEKAAQAAKGSGSSQTALSPAVACRECALPKVSGSCYCETHKRPVQNMYKASHKKNKDGTYVNPEQQKAYMEIFGKGRDGPTDPARASQ